jgi:trk system potassium uptake protein
LIKKRFINFERFISLTKRVRRIPFILSVFALIIFFYEIGFEHGSDIRIFTHLVYKTTFSIIIISIIGRYFHKASRPRIKILPFEIIFVLVLSMLILHDFRLEIIHPVFSARQELFLFTAIFIAFVRELSAIRLSMKRVVVNPAQLFIFSFLLIIIIGGFLLMLPKATHTNISLVDAMFTSTSAVCVTGLIVVDTGSFFTVFGQTIILVLIQIGGIGIMTFASYFSYFFRGVSSYKNQLVIREMTNTEKIGEVFNVLKRILLITFFIEGIGALLIFQSTINSIIQPFDERFFFSVFHSVSGFCNAGFSTLENSMYESSYRFNYPLHLILATLIILGGLGFPVVVNLIRFAKVKFLILVSGLFRKKHLYQMPWLLNINTRIVLITSLVLTILGTVLFYLFEYNNTLAGHSFFGKIITSFFGSVTTRTAGFNTVDTSALHIPTLLIVMFLMWVGASPGSTGGGIKTSSFTIAVLNIISIAKGKTRLEIFNREVSVISVYRAFTVIVLSIFVIGISSFTILLLNPELGLLNIVFETISAYSTVGLSRGITADLGSYGKMVLILTMFIGRISMLTLLIAVFKKVSSEKYQFPSESILIN